MDRAEAAVARSSDLGERRIEANRDQMSAPLDDGRARSFTASTSTIVGIPEQLDRIVDFSVVEGEISGFCAHQVTTGSWVGHETHDELVISIDSPVLAAAAWQMVLGAD